MRTRIYIDGYNFYYGCLKNSPAYKWLDLVRLFEDYILPRSVNPHSKLHSSCGIKFYTADISSNVAQDPNSQRDQQSYHSALKNRYANQSKIDIVKGNYAIGKIDSKKVEYSPDGKTKPPKDCASVKVWKFEEKQSDVNIAVDALFDAFTDTTLEQIVFVTNDTDLTPALQKIRQFNQLSTRTPLQTGLVTPIIHNRSQHTSRKTNESLKALADWNITGIQPSELQKSQLPCRITGGKKPAIRPTSWFEHSQEVAAILETLSQKDVCGTYAKAWAWLTREPHAVNGLPELPNDPSVLLHTLKGIDILQEHVNAFAAYRKSN